MFFWFHRKEIKRLLNLLEEQIVLQKQSRLLLMALVPKISIEFFIKGEKMADLVLNLGDTKTATLHYLSKGADLGVVPSSDSPSFTVDDPASISLTVNPDGSVSLKDTHNGDTDVNVNLTGSAKGFTVVKVITCKGVAPPTPVPDAVDIVFS